MGKKKEKSKDLIAPMDKEREKCCLKRGISTTYF
jgi:hypothetical protein